MIVEGEQARHYQAVDLSSLMAVPGELVSADDQTGTVVTTDKTGEHKTHTFGPRRIKIIRKYTYGR